MSLRSLEYASVESVVGIRRNSLMSIVSITTVGLSLAILGGFVLLILGLHNVAETLPNKLEIAVFLDKDIPEADMVELDSKIRYLPHVESVQLLDADAAWEKFKRDLGDRVELGGVEQNPLPDSFRVKVDDPRYAVTTADAIRKMDHIDEVNEGRKEVEQIVRFSDLIKLIGGLSAAVLFLVTIFLISNTIRLTVWARRREIRIMQLVGATNWFIRLPLVFEGIILGAIGGGIACLLVFGGASYVTQLATEIMPLLSQFSSSVDPMYFFGSLVAVGCLTGAMGSLISIRRFLKA